MTSKLRVLLCALVAFSLILVAALNSQAALIDFETGFADLDPVGAVVVLGIVVTFSVGPNSGPTGTGLIAQVGVPETAFVPNDTPAGGLGGAFFLTDERAGPNLALDYFIDFSVPVSDLSLDFYDYRVDGGPSAGDTATLNVYG